MTYEELISGRKRGWIAALGRAGLLMPAYAYERIIALRNAYYDTWAMPAWLDVPVISVGNLTVGGTGKTPMTVWLCERMLARGLKPAVLSRGYKAQAEGVADELLLVSRRVPQAIAVAHADRTSAGRLAIEEYHAQVAILDDGFQHRRLGRDLDFLLVDATRPFGYGHILPRGLLRERVSSVRRADAIIITRCDQADPAAIDAIRKEIHSWNRELPIVRAVHAPGGFADLTGQKVDRPACVRAGMLAGIARPDAFRRTLASLGIMPAAEATYGDHYAYSAADVPRVIEWICGNQLDCVLTTEKDAVKLARIESAWPVPVASVTVGMQMLDDGAKLLEDLIDRMLREHESAKAEEETADGKEAKE